MKIITATLIGMMFLISTAQAEPKKINVKPSTDTDTIGKTMFDISLGTLMPCMQKSGKMDDATEQACFCKNSKTIEDKLKKIDAVLTKHPGWVGNILVIKDKDGTLSLELKNIPDMRKKMASCK